MAAKGVIAVVVLGAFLSLAAATSFNQCKDGSPVPESLSVSGCEEPPCYLQKGTTLDANTTFFTEVGSESFTALVRAYVLGLAVDYPLADPDVCNGLVLAECPIEPGEMITYRLLFPLLNVFPSIAVTIELRFEDSDQNIASCFSLDIQVMDASR